MKPSLSSPTPTTSPEAGQDADGRYIRECISLAFAPPDTRQPPEWAEEHITIPNSARGTKKFYRTTYPMMNEPLCRSVDPKVRRLVVLAPTGGGKTNLLDISTPYALANSLGSILMTIQGKGKSEEYCEERLWPILDACGPVVAMKPVGPKSRHLIKKDSRVYPSASLFVDGDNKGAAQRRSVTFVRLDEAWLIKYGLIAEFEARLHDRWNGQITLISQGGEQKVHDQKIELDEFWKTTDQAELHFRCPRCGHDQPYWWDGDAKRYSLCYDLVRRENGSVDYNATAKTARMVCENPKCPDPVFSDTYENRRALAESLDGHPEQYQATAIPEKEGYCGRHYNALAMYWVTWHTLTVEWLKAVQALKDGDPEPMVTFVTKRLARTYWLPKKSANVVLTAANYKLAEYWEPGTKIDNEFARFMAIDFQQGHWWVLVRAFRVDRSSRLLFASKITNEQMLVLMQERFEVPSNRVFFDANWEPGLAYDLCAKHGWLAVEGDKAPSYPSTEVVGGVRKVVLRYYSQINPTAAPGGGVCNRIMFSRVKVTDETVKLRDGKDTGWEHGQDTPEDWLKHTVSEEKIETKGEHGKPTFKYERIKGRRNDLWWCEVAVTLGALILGILRPVVGGDDDAVDTPSDSDGIKKATGERISEDRTNPE